MKGLHGWRGQPYRLVFLCFPATRRGHALIRLRASDEILQEGYFKRRVADAVLHPEARRRRVNKALNDGRDAPLHGGVKRGPTVGVAEVQADSRELEHRVDDFGVSLLYSDMHRL
jgi:hypothetical protein